MQVSVTYKKNYEVLHRETGEVTDDQSFRELAAKAVDGFRRKNSEISLFDDGVVSFWDKA